MLFHLPLVFANLALDPLRQKGLRCVYTYEYDVVEISPSLGKQVARLLMIPFTADLTTIKETERNVVFVSAFQSIRVKDTNVLSSSLIQGNIHGCSSLGYLFRFHHKSDQSLKKKFFFSLIYINKNQQRIQLLGKEGARET